MASLGKQRVLLDALRPDGRSVIAIWCDWTVHRRANGTLYTVMDGLRVDIQERDDGTLYYPHRQDLFNERKRAVMARRRET